MTGNDLKQRKNAKRYEQTDGQTNQKMERASYRVAWTGLRRKS